jgi:hypothetical protein
MHNKNLHKLYFLTKTIREVKSSRTNGWGMWQIWGAKRNAYRMLVGNAKGHGTLATLRRRFRMRVECILNKRYRMRWITFVWFNTGANGGLL